MSKIKFIPQPYLSKQCGQTCLSMITGEDIENICKEIDNYYTTNIYTNLQEYLNKDFKTLVAYGKFNMEEVPNNSIVRLNKPDNSGHFILKTEEGKLFDPSVGIVEKYLNHTTITHYLTFKKTPDENQSTILRENK